MNTILPYHDVNISKLKFKKPYYSTSKMSKVPIKYKKNNFIIQVPKLFIPFDILLDNNKCFLFLSLSNYKIQKEVEVFYNKIREIEQLIIKKFLKYPYKSKKKLRRDFCYTIKESSRNNLYMRVRIPFFKNKPLIKVFNQDKKEVEFNSICAKLYCVTLICFENVWFYDNRFGITINLIQIKLFMPLSFTDYLFRDDNELKTNNVNSYENNPIYKKYFKMIKMGVPKRVVKQKMMLCGLEPNILDGKHNSSIKPCIPNNLFSHGKSTLKRVKHSIHKKHITCMKNKGYNVPTLSEIQIKLSSLRRLRKYSEA